MNESHDESLDGAFADKAKEAFDDSVAGLDAATLSALNRHRQVALAELESRRVTRLAWLPAAGVAAAGVAAVMLWTASPPLQEADMPVATDMEILLDEDSLEMLEELEFYSWIDLDEAMSEPQPPQNHVG